MVINKPGHFQAGVTLMELMITVVIIGILSAIAIPNYTNHVRKSNRTEATSALLALAAAQEKFYLRNSQYTDDITILGESTTIGRMYTLSVAIDTVTGGFEASAVALSSSQVNDLECRTFTIDHTGRRTVLDEGNAVTTDKCW